MRIFDADVTGSLHVSGSSELKGNLVVSGSQTITGSLTVDGNTKFGDQISDNHNFTGSVNISGSHTLTGSLNLLGNQFVSGSVYILNDLIVHGTSSVLYLTASQLAVSESYISVNVFEPLERFGGIKVYDSGSSNATASLTWDSEKNHWVYTNTVDAMYSGGMLISGPRNTGSLGDEVGTINNRVTKGQGGDHITSSNITDTGTIVSINSNSEITGSLIVTNGLSGSLDYSYLINTPTLVSGSSQISYSGLTGIPSNIISGSAQIYSLGFLTGYTDTNTFTTGATFNTGDGVITFTKNDGGTYTVDIDGRFQPAGSYLTGYTETDTFDNVTDRGSVTTNTIEVGGLTTNGDIQFGPVADNNVNYSIKSGGQINIHSNNQGTADQFFSNLVLKAGDGSTQSVFNIGGSNASTPNQGLWYTFGGSEYFRLSNNGTTRFNAYSTNGFVKFINSDGTLGVDTNTYLTSTSLNGYATTGYVQTQITNLIDSSPSTLDTLNELAAALGDDPNFATTVATSIGNKVSKSGDTMTGNLTAPKFITSGGTSSQFVKGDGTLDSNTYLTAHPSVSAAGSSNNSGRTYIQDILLDGFGHITGITTATETVTDTNDFISDVTFDGTNLTFNGSGGAFSSPVDISSVNTDTNYYVTGATFNTGNGVITLTRNDGGTVTVDLDGRYQATGSYLTGYTETDTLATVTARGNTTNQSITVSGVTSYNDVVISGGTLTVYESVSGATVFAVDGTNGRLFAVTDDLSNSLFSVNTISGLPVIEAFADYHIVMGRFNQNDFYLGTTGEIGMGSLPVSGYKLAVTGNVRATSFVKSGGTSTQFLKADGSVDSNTYLTSYLNYYTTGVTFNTGDGVLTFTRTDGGTYTVDLDGRYSSSSSDYYTTGATFNTSNGVITYTRNDGGTYTVDIDGRFLTSYSEISTLEDVVQRGDTTTLSITAASFITQGGNSGQFVKGDGSLDSNTYLTAHPSVSAASSSNNSGRTYIQDILLDSFGHITGITTASETVTDTNYYVTGATFNTGDGVITLTRNDGNTITVDIDGRFLTAHPSVSAASSSDNSGRTYIQDILLDSFGHITGITTGTETVVDTNTNYYVTGATFNTGNGVITMTRNDGGTVTVDIDGKYSELGHTHDDRYLPYSKTSDVNKASGWYTIAVNVSNRAVGKFILRDTSSGNHQSVVFYATHHYGNYSDITVLINSRYSGNPFRYIRIQDGGTYDGALLQVYIDDSSSQVQAWMLENIQASGWVIKDWVDEAVDPGDVSNFPALTETPAQVDLDQTPQGGMIVTGPIYGGGDITQYEYLNTNNYSTTTDTRYYTETEIANFFGGSVAITGYNKSNWDTAYGWGNHASQGYATTGYVTTQIANLIDSAPSALDTLNELAAALGDDANFATTIASSIGAKLPLSGGTMTGNIAFGATSNLGLTWGLNTDAAFIKFISTSNAAGASYLEIGTQDDSDEEIKFTQSGNLRFYLATDGFLKNGGGYKYLYESGTWGIDISGNAATVTNGVYSNGSYSNPSWITALAGSKITGNISGNAYNITQYTINQDLGTSNSPTFYNVTATGVYGTNTGSSRNKYNVYGNSGTYAIGMESGNNFGGLADWAMTFQMNNDDDRGFWWGDDGHNTSQGAMVLTTNGYLTVARGVRVGYGESDTSTPNVPLQVYGSGSLVFDVQGSQGQLFSITDSLSGSLFSVNDISGLPILEVFSDDKLVAGSFGTNAFVVSGTTTTVSGSLAVSGSATVNGGTVWHSGNDGSSSGLDADTLDGLHASSFLTAHPSVSAAGSSDNSGRTYIQDILLDSFGHITGITTATETVVDTDTNYYVTGATFNTSTGVITMTRNDGGTVTVDIDGKYLDSSSYTASDVLSKLLTVDGSGSGLDADLLDGNNSSYFINTSNIGSQSVSYASTAGFSDEAKWISFPDGPRDLSDRNPNWNNRSVAWDFVTAGTADGSGNYAGVMTFSPWDGTSASTGDSSYQLAFANATGVNASGQPKLSIRNGINTTWNSWYTLLHSGNIGSFTSAHISVSAAGSSNNSGRTYIQDILLDSYGHITGITTASETVTDTNDFISDVTFDGTNLTFTGSGGAFSSPVDISSVNTDTNYYVTGATFNTSTGVITMTRNDGGTVTVDIDGKYQEAGTYLGAISYNNNSNSNYQLLWGSGNAVYGTAEVYVNPSSDYVYAASFNASDWFRSSTQTGWYNTTYEGGIYMTESTMVRVYNNKGFWIDGGNTNTVNDATLYVTATNNNDWLAQFNAYNSSKSEYGIYVNIAAGATYGYALRTDSSSFTYRVDGSGRVYAPIYYDINDTAYYLNPASTSNLATVKLNSTASGTEVFTVDGVNGRLFTITDDLSNSLFSVNTIAGVPVIEAFADNKVIMGRYNQNDLHISSTGEIGMGNTSVSGYKLAVTGNLRATSFVKTGGSSSQFLMADGSVSTNPGWITSYTDTNNYTTGVTWNGSTAVLTFTRNNGDTYNVTMLESISDVTVTGGTYSAGTLTLTKSNGGTVTVTGFSVVTDTNTYVTGATFNTGNGVITMTRTDGGTVTVDIDGRYLESYSETDTLDSVLSRGASTTRTAEFYQTSNTFINTVAAANRGLTVYQDTAGADAYMTFHIGGDYAGYFGLGGAENDLVWGGWSVGNVRYRIWHSGNDGSGSGLDADTVDGIHASSFLTAHPSVSAAGSSNNSGRTYIQDILLDGFGHITGITTASETVVDTNDFISDVNFDGTSLLFTGSGGAFNSSVDISSINTDTNYYVTGATFNTSTGVITMTRNDGGTVTVDIDGKYAESSHTHDDRYYTETESDGRFQPLENQRLSTGNSPTFVDIYANEWFRNNNANEGLYNTTTTQHLSSNTNGYWDMSSTTTYSGIRFYTGGHVSALRGYIYANTSNEIGFLNTGGNWSLRCDNSQNVHVTTAVYAPIYYDSNDNNYYLNPASTSNLKTVKVNSTVAGTEALTVDGVNGRLFTITDDMTDSIFSVNTISGLPVIEAFADYKVVMGRYNQNDFIINPSGQVSIGNTAQAAYKFTVFGGQWGSYFRGGDLGTGSDIARFVDSAGTTIFLVRGDGAVLKDGNTVWHAGNDGASSGLDADLLDGQHGSYYAAASSLSSYLPLGGGTMTGTITITNTDIRSNSTSNWTGDPGTQGKIQYHSARWYIVSDSASDRIVQFRRNGTDVSYIDNSGNFIGNASTATNVDYGGLTGTVPTWNQNTTGTASNITAYTINQSVGTGNSPTFAGLTSNGVGVFNSTNDTQISLRSTDSWSGIEFDDSGTPDYIWYNGGNQTFSIGGGGGNVSGKKLHVHGGVTIGSSYTATSVTTNGLAVEGAISASNFSGSSSGTNTGDQTNISGNAATATYATTAGALTSMNISQFTNNSGYITSYVDTNYYVTGATFNTSTGVITMTRNDGGTVTVDIDGKYAESSHTHDDRYFTETESDARFQPLENQRLSTGNSPSFSQVFTTQIGIDDSGIDCYMEVGDGNPTEDGINYGGTFHFYGDKTIGLSHLYFGGAYVTNNFVVGGRITENSSIRYKKDIETLEGGLDKVLAMRGVTYVKKDTGIKEVGLIAEELAEILPEVVGFDTQGQPDSVSYSRLTAILVEAIKDLKKEIDELKGKK